MEKEQRILNSNLGNDTHVRSFDRDIHKKNSHSVVGMLTGEISGVDAEPIYKQTLVKIQLAQGGEATSVPYPGAFIDPGSGNFHGVFEGPIPGQMVIIGFENCNFGKPFVVNRYPYQGIGDTENELKYNTPLTNAGFHPSDVIVGHFSGTFISLNTGIFPSEKKPGSMNIVTVSDFEIECQDNLIIDVTTETKITSPKAIFDCSDAIELNGNSNYAVKYNELKTAFDQLKSDFDNFVSTIYNLHVHPSPAGGSTGTTPTTGSASTADMSDSKNEKVLF